MLASDPSHAALFAPLHVSPPASVSFFRPPRRLRTGGGGNAEKVPDYRVGLSSAPARGGDGPNLLRKAMSATTADRKAGKNAG